MAANTSCNIRILAKNLWMIFLEKIPSASGSFLSFTQVEDADNICLYPSQRFFMLSHGSLSCCTWAYWGYMTFRIRIYSIFQEINGKRAIVEELP